MSKHVADLQEVCAGVAGEVLQQAAQEAGGLQRLQSGGACVRPHQRQQHCQRLRAPHLQMNIRNSQLT